MTETPFIPTTSGKFQKVITQLQDNEGTDYDETNPLPVEIKGSSDSDNSFDEVKVSDDTSATILNSILKELKLINLHLSLLNEMKLEKTEVE